MACDATLSKISLPHVDLTKVLCSEESREESAEGREVVLRKLVIDAVLLWKCVSTGTKSEESDA